MNHKFMGDDDLIYNTASRLPVCLCIDLSHSMLRVISEEGTVDTGRTEFKDGQEWRIVEGGINLISEVERGVNLFYDAIRNNDQARLSCEISVVTFSDDSNILEDFTSIDSKSDFSINYDEIGNNTAMGKGVEKALELLENRKKSYKLNGVDHYQPWLVLFTDGEPSDNVSCAQQKCRELENQEKLTVFTFALSDDVNKSILSGFSKRKPISIRNDKIDKFFEWLGKSVSIVSQSKVGDKVKLDKTGIDEWIEI